MNTDSGPCFTGSDAHSVGSPKPAEGWPAPAAWADLGPLLGVTTTLGKRDAWRRAANATPEALAIALRDFAERGVVVLSLMDERLSAAWRLLRKSERPPLVALIPNARGMIREATEHGMIGAGVRRVRRLGPLALARLGFAHLADGPGVLRRDFPTMLRVLNGVEASEARRLGAAHLVLSPQMTDLALAMDQPAILWDFIRRAEGRAKAGLATNNPLALAARLSEAPPPKFRSGPRFAVAMNPRKTLSDPLPPLPDGWIWAPVQPAISLDRAFSASFPALAEAEA